jgi:hypothetical protein
VSLFSYRLYETACFSHLKFSLPLHTCVFHTELTRALGYERRIAAITNACETFDHSDESMHNTELHQGAATALSKLLALSAFSDDEIRMTCAALEMVLRGNPKSVQAAYEGIHPSFLSQLLRQQARCESSSTSSSSPHAAVMYLNISRILLNLSRCPGLRVELARHPGLLQALVMTTMTTTNAGSSATAEQTPRSTSSQHTINSYAEECRLIRIRTLANLAKCDDNKVFMYQHDDTLPFILRVAHMDSNPTARHFAAITLQEFASIPANQRRMAHDDTLLGTAVKMILMEPVAGTREAVITAVQTMAFCQDNRLRLCTFRAGIVLEALKKSLASDTNSKARRRAAGALTNLACHSTAQLIGSHQGLLDTLAIAATKDSNRDVQTRAAVALTKIANVISVHMANGVVHEALLDALVVASLSSDASSSISAVLRVKAREPENRVVLARHPGILDTLSDICLSDTSSVNERDNAVRAIMHLVNEDKNRKTMCNKTILDALVTSASYKDPALSEARDSAMRAMERLGTEFANRQIMARHTNLLIVVAGAVEREAQWEEEGKKSEHGFLAKPLLMGLLVAM